MPVLKTILQSHKKKERESLPTPETPEKKRKKKPKSGKNVAQHPTFYLYEASEKGLVRMVNSHQPAKRLNGSLLLQ